MFQEATVSSKRAFKARLVLGPVHWVDVSSRYCSLLTLVPGYIDALYRCCALLVLRPEWVDVSRGYCNLQAGI